MPAIDPLPLKVEWEEHPWATSARQQQRTADALRWGREESGDPALRWHIALQLEPTGPYQACIPAALADLDVPLAPDVLALAEEAAVALAVFDAELPHLMKLGESPDGLAELMCQLDGIASSELERIAITPQDLATAVCTRRTARHPAAGLVRANVETNLYALNHPGWGSVALLEAHTTLMHTQPRANPGNLRQVQCWIGGRTPHTAQFVPPHPARVGSAIEDLTSFLRRRDIPRFAHAAIAHAQFETIHPFNDGNGRTGRALVHAVLRNRGITRNATAPISSGLLAEHRGYIEGLIAFREGNPNHIIEQFARATISAIANSRELINQLNGITEVWTEALQDRGTRADGAATRLLPHLISQPAITTRHVMSTLQISQPAAHRAIERLTQAGIVEPLDQAQRGRVWVASEVLAAQTQFLERAHRNY